MNEEKSVIIWRRVTIIMAVLFLMSLILPLFPTTQEKLDKHCMGKNIQLDYAKIDTDNLTFSCCKVFMVWNGELNYTTQREGCSFRGGIRYALND